MVCSRSPISFEKLLMRARRMPNMENGLTLSPTELNEWIIAMLDLCKGPHDSNCPNCFAEI
ncbi:hypothetical protein C8Q78DRAFT_1082462 [Trametes maxima]|nr:hypothetical protein C8Q78DRAFT_1082462 [Trametes maxima]